MYVWGEFQHVLILYMCSVALVQTQWSVRDCVSEMCVCVLVFEFKPILENWLGSSRCDWWRSTWRPALCKLLGSSRGRLKSGNPLDNKDLEFIFAELPAMYT